MMSVFAIGHSRAVPPRPFRLLLLQTPNTGETVSPSCRVVYSTLALVLYIYIYGTFFVVSTLLIIVNSHGQHCWYIVTTCCPLFIAPTRSHTKGSETLFPAIVTTNSFFFILVGSPYKPSFATTIRKGEAQYT